MFVLAGISNCVSGKFAGFMFMRIVWCDCKGLRRNFVCRVERAQTGRFGEAL